MASKGVTTDLVIRTSEIKTKPLDDLLVTLEKLTVALDALDKEGGPASKSLQELTSEARKFEQVAAELAGRKALLESFEGAQRGADLAKKSLVEAKRALEEFQATLPEKKKDRTADQAAQFDVLSKAVKSATASARQAEKSLGTTSDKLQAIGIDASNAAEELQRLAAAERAAVAGLDRATVNVQGYSQALRDQKQALRDKAAAEATAAAAAESAAAAARKAEQAESDRLALLEAAGRARQQQQGQEMAAGELATIREYEERERRRAEAIKATTDALARQRAQEKEAASNLRVLGGEAEKAAEDYRKLADEARDLASKAAPSTRTLAQEIGKLANPAREAAMSMGEIEQALAAVTQRQARASQAFHQGEDDLKQLAQDHLLLGKALRETERQAGALDGYREAQQQFERTGSALERARQALASYAAQARASGTSDDALEQGLREQRAELDRLVGAYQRQAAAVSQMGGRLREAGVDLRNLADAEARIVQQAQALRRALDAASDSTTRLGQATQRAQEAGKKWGEEQRTALSLTQRIRGQILSLTAAYVGLFGVISEARASLDAVTSTQAVTNRMAVAFGDDPGEVSRQLKMVEADADRLGTSLRGAAEGYSRFAVAARSGGASAEETFFVFSKMTEVSRVFKLSAEEQKRVFKALEQMMSKGKIQAEELSQQLGDSLPGAMSMMAKAMKMSSAELFKAMEKGQVSSKNLVLFANEYAKAVKDQVVKASKSWQAELQRLDTSLYKFRQNVGSGGFAESMGALARALSDALNSEDGRKAAQALSDVFGFVADAARQVVPVVQGFFAAIADGVQLVKDFGTDLTELANGMRALIGLDAARPVEDLNEALRELGRVLAEIALVAAVAMMLKFGGAAVEAGSAVTSFGAAVVAALAGGGGVAAALTVVKGGVKALTEAWEGLNVVARAFILVGVFEVFKAIGDAAYEASVTVRKFAGGLVGIAKVMAGFATGGREGMMAAYAEVQDYVKALDDEVAAEKRAAKAREDAAKKSAAAWEKAKGYALPGSEVAGESRRLAARGAAAAQDRENALLPKKPILLAADDTKKAEAEARRAQKAYEALLRTVDRGLDAMELKGAKGGARELEEALAAIDQQYEQLYEKIEQLNKSDRKAAVARADAAKELIKANTRVEFERKAAAERLTGIEAERDALLEAAKARAEADPGAALQVQQELIEITTRYRDRVVEAAEAALLLAEAQGRIADAAKFRATITKAKAFDPQAELRQAQIADLQKQLDLQTQLRDTQIARVQAQVDPTGVDTAAETARIMAEFQGRLTAITAQIRELATAGGDLALVGQIDALNAELAITDQRTVDVQNQVVQSFGSGLTEVFMESTSAIAKWARGVGSFSDAWVAARDSVRNFAASFLQMLAQILAQKAAMNLINGLLGGGQGANFVGPQEPTVWQGLLGSFSKLATMHNGGIVGSPGGWSQSAPALAFAGAPRFHSGGLPGLAADEVPAILQRGEEVLSRDNPRNILNGGGMTQAAPTSPGITVVNTIDPEQVVAAGLSDRAFVNYIAANKSQVRKAIGL